MSYLSTSHICSAVAARAKCRKCRPQKIGWFDCECEETIHWGDTEYEVHIDRDDEWRITDYPRLSLDDEESDKEREREEPVLEVHEQQELGFSTPGRWMGSGGSACA